MKLHPIVFAICVPAVLPALHAQTSTIQPGDPLPGLSIEQIQLFQSGRDAFLKSISNASASLETCSGCHRQEYVVRDGRRTNVPPLFGGGLIEAIPDEVLFALQNRPEALALGIRGHAAVALDSTGKLRVGRFGSKAQHATLFDATPEGLSVDLGVPESVFRNETPDPVTGLRTIDKLTAYSRFLAPIGQLTGPTTASAAGGSLFNSIGCAACHVRSIVSPPAGQASSGQVTINPFSDFLLHDIGTGDGIALGAALPNEIRTTPLWGLRLRTLFLHDGSAVNLTDAIRAHRGDATTVIRRFDTLSSSDRQAVIEFLKTL